MKSNELNKWLEEQSGNIEWSIEEDLDGTPVAMHFRDSNLSWYKENLDRSTRVPMQQLEEITDGNALLHQIRKGLDVVGITRITGYMSKIASWNEGKLGELHDRVRHEVL
jgi:hypothetical protein